VIFPDEPSRLAAMRRSNEILQAIPGATAVPTERESSGIIASNPYNLGHEHWARGRPGEALAAFLAAQAIYDRLLESADSDTRVGDLAGRNLLYLGKAHDSGSRDLALAARRRAESIFPTLVREYPDRFEFGWQLSNAQDELVCFLLSGRHSREATAAFERVRQRLVDMVGPHGKLVSRMASIHERTAAVHINLMEAYADDRAKKRPRMPGAHRRGK
jgi:hypothetical protein